MAFTNFCCRSGGSNLNAGTRTGDTTEPGTGAFKTYTSGTWVSATRVFTVASGNPTTDGIAVGDFASVYPDAATVAVFIGRVTARDATTITISGTAKSGTSPVDGTTNTTIAIGGAWKGPNAAENFPFGFITTALTNVAGDKPRVNFKNDASYSITAAITHSLAGFLKFEGYTSSYGDFGRATIDGGTSGASYVLLTTSGNGGRWFSGIIFQNNGATGSANACAFGTEDFVERCVFANVRGSGVSWGGLSLVVECEAYGCNQSNTANFAGFVVSDAPGPVRCISHDNTGSNSSGFRLSAAVKNVVEGCIADTNGQYGFNVANGACTKIVGCDAYNNTSHGIFISASTAGFGYSYHIENCNLVKNGGSGISIGTGGENVGYVRRCGFGSGTQANTSGTIANGGTADISDIVTYAADVTPWVDPANGDFRINLATAKGAGRGTFTQTAASYAGTVGYPAIGAAQPRTSRQVMRI